MGILDKIFNKVSVVPEKEADSLTQVTPPKTQAPLVINANTGEEVGPALVDDQQTKDFRQSQEELAAQEVYNDLLAAQEREAYQQMAKAIAQREQLYLLLSIEQANYHRGLSQPYVGQMPDGRKLLFLFDSYDQAKAYLDEVGYELVDGVYPIGKLSASDPLHTLKSVLNLAYLLDIDLVDFNPRTEQAFGFQIPWFFEVNGWQLEEQVSIIVPEARGQAIREGKAVPTLTFNALAIEHFSPAYQVSAERLSELTSHLYGASDPNIITSHFTDSETLHENVVLFAHISDVLIPEAQVAGREGQVAYFQVMLDLLRKVIWMRLADSPLYTLIHPVTGQLLLKNGRAYVLYTDRFKFEGKYDYQALASRAELIDLIAQTGISQLVITDGSDEMAIIDTKQLV